MATENIIMKLVRDHHKSRQDCRKFISESIFSDAEPLTSNPLDEEIRVLSHQAAAVVKEQGGKNDVSLPLNPSIVSRYVVK